MPSIPLLRSLPVAATTRITRASALLLMLLLYIVGTLAYAEEPVSRSRLGGVAIGGHDTVSYHALQRQPQASAVLGGKAHEVRYKGAIWRFASAESAERFRADPDAFTPAYNGFCANALSLGEGLIRTDGTHWEIFDDKLYLFFAGRGRTRWIDGDWQQYKTQADAAWASLSR